MFKYKSVNKKKLLFVFLILLVVILSAAIFSLGQNNINNPDNQYKELASKIEAEFKSQNNGQSPSAVIVSDLNKLTDPNMPDQEKYNTLNNLVFFFTGAYSSTHDPKIRSFVKNTMGEFAKKNLAKYYKEGNFDMACADPACGEQIDKELNNIIGRINADNNLDEGYKNNFIDNLKTAGYLPNSEIKDKQFGFRLVFKQMENIGQKNASETANLIKIYFKNKYGKDLYANI